MSEPVRYEVHYCITDTPSTGSVAAVFPKRSPILELTAVDVAAREGSGVGDYIAACPMNCCTDVVKAAT
jgi:hypothetical protein